MKAVAQYRQEGEMAAPLLKTKLHVPPVRLDLVPRPRLVERLNAGLHRKLTLVSAPAGFGKTTALADSASRISDLPFPHMAQPKIRNPEPVIGSLGSLSTETTITRRGSGPTSSLPCGRAITRSGRMPWRCSNPLDRHPSNRC